MKVEQVIYDNYMPYAEGVIKERAVQDIAGLKPVQTRILHAMYREKLFDKRRKAAGIVGETMKCHPNGDAAIYDAMVRLVDSHEGLMCPLIKGKGNYGKSYSRDLAYAASRYPEASLMPIAKEFFDGLEDNAVDMVPNYDGTLKEPKVLPVKFPNVLVNTSSGIAVGVASQIPSFSLRDVCKATIGVIRGEIETAEELADVLGYPDFPTGGFIHEDEGELVKLMRTGRGTFNVSGGTDLYSNAIIIKGVPFGTNIENVIEGIKANLKTELKEIDRVTDLTDINGLHIEIHLKGGADPRKVVKKLRSLTKLTMKMSFNTAVIINGEYRQLGVFELINEWVSFRAGCIQRVYQKRHGDLAEREHKLSAFEKIAGRLDEADAIMKRQESEVVELLKSTFDMDDVQAEYLGDCKRKEFYADRVMKRLEELKKLRETMAEYLKLATDDSARLGLICDELVEFTKLMIEFILEWDRA